MLPTAPIPVHTAYAVPNGNDRSASAINPKLSAIAITVAAVGQNLVSPSEYFNPSAQPTSSSPAARSAAQALMRFPAFRNEVWTLAASLVENVRVSSMRCSHDRDVTGASTIVLERLAAVAKLKCVRATM